MTDQLLEQARLAVVGPPWLEFVVVREKQLAEVIRVFAVVLGAAGDERFAELLQGDGIDGVERDPLVGFKEEDQAGRRLLTASQQK